MEVGKVLLEALLADYFARIQPGEEIVLTNKRTKQRVQTRFGGFHAETGQIEALDKQRFDLRRWYFNLAQALEYRRQAKKLRQRLEFLEKEIARLRPPFPRKEANVGQQVGTVGD